MIIQNKHCRIVAREGINVTDFFRYFENVIHSQRPVMIES